MHSPSHEQRRHLQQLGRDALEQLQLEKLNRLLATILPANTFYAKKLGDHAQEIADLSQLAELPITTKYELQPAGPAEPFAANRTFPLEHYVRFHQTSGTRGQPLVVVDTAEDWRWWIECWQYVLDAAEVDVGDRALLAFSFGPFIGFWSAFDAVANRGAMAIPAGGMSSVARLRLIERTGATILFATPTYALHLAEIARAEQIELGGLAIKKIVVAGEPGGSVPSTRARIESSWQAEVVDHSGATEVGAWGFADTAGKGLYINEAEFLAEFVSVDSGKPAISGELSQLLLTTLGRTGAPLVRYQTGDLVRPVWNPQGFVFLEGGVLGRADDMMIVRGINLFPSSVEEILHSFPEVVEYRLTVSKRGEMDELSIEVEDRLNQPERIAAALQLELGLRCDVRCVAEDSLPRFEGKARRFVDLRKEGSS